MSPPILAIRRERVLHARGRGQGSGRGPRNPGSHGAELSKIQSTRDAGLTGSVTRRGAETRGADQSRDVIQADRAHSAGEGMTCAFHGTSGTTVAQGAESAFSCLGHRRKGREGRGQEGVQLHRELGLIQQMNSCSSHTNGTDADISSELLHRFSEHGAQRSTAAPCLLASMLVTEAIQTTQLRNWRPFTFKSSQNAGQMPNTRQKIK